MELLNKITMKAMDVQPKVGALAEGEKYAVAVIFGRSQGAKLKTSDYGESFAFSGNFEATRIADGAKFKSSKVFLPKTIEGLLAAAHAESDEPIDFAIEVGVKYAKNAFGYEWTVKPLIENTGAADQLAHLRGAADAALAALPAPVHNESAPATDAEPAVKKSAKK